jgi:hypothetical protein
VKETARSVNPIAAKMKMRLGWDEEDVRRGIDFSRGKLRLKLFVEAKDVPF